MKKQDQRISMLLAEEINGSRLATLTGGSDSGTRVPLYPHDLVTPNLVPSGYIPDPPSLTNNPQ